VLFDQRSCGRSRPLASEPAADLSTNTTAHLIADIEALRELLGVERWVVVGLSWGSTLGLAYAEAYPERVSKLIVGLVGTTSKREVQWATEEVGRLFPREWAAFAEAIPLSLRALPLVEAYARLLFDPDPAIVEKAAIAWCTWEDAHISLSPGHQPNPRFQDLVFRLGFARLVTHYWKNSAFLEENQLLKEAHRLDGIPGVLIHGRYDVSSPLESAWKLAKVWKSGRLCVLEDAGHGGEDSFYRALKEGLGD
jgi:proline iminopeptidase